MKLPNPISYKTLEETEWPEEIMIEGGLLSRGDRMLLAADSKAGKSTLLGQMIYSLVSASDFLGFQVRANYRVLYMQAELRESRLKQRLSKIYSGLSPELKENFIIWGTRGLVLINKNFDAIERVLEHYRPDILVIDPMANFNDFEENNSTAMMEFFRILDNIKQKFNLALIMAHHLRKANQNSSKKRSESLLERIRGSGALRGWADTNLCIHGRQGDRKQVLEFELRNADEIHERVLAYNQATRSFDWESPRNTIENWASDFIKSNPGITSTTFVQSMMATHKDLVGLNRTKAFKIKEALVSTGILSQQVQSGGNIKKLYPISQ